jgi:tagaturonate reductase
MPLPTLARRQLADVRRDRRGIVTVPDDSLLDLPERAVQFGTGALLRGFVDDFLDRANVAGLFGGRVVAVGSTGSSRDRALRDQDALYTLAVEGIDAGQPVQECRIIASLSRALSAVHEWDEVLALARAPLLQYVFSNTTEVGIALDPTDALDALDAAPPASFPAKLTRFLLERARELDYDPSAGLIVVPCELIENNGDRLRALVLELATRWALGPAFIDWVETSVQFCNTLVDRIVPGVPRGADAERLADMLGYRDGMLTTCEPYRLFAIEGDEALRERMRWTSVDPAIIVAPDITPYRERKVRLLNGAHTTLVSPALLMGCETVREAVTHPALGRFVRQAMLDEIVPTLEADGAADFAEAVLDRFRNPFIRHALVDITLQATMKMRVRVVPSIVAHGARTGRPPQALAFGFAAFLLLMRGERQAERRAQGLSVPADDGAARLTRHWLDAGGDVQRLTRVVCADTQLWTADLSAVPGFAEAVADHLRRVETSGIATALDHHLTTPVT